ncbi:ATP synthase F1 subcomplex epsilon subunit [Cribrihabitans marinus]|uniref:ATP synthase epsilon chain n=1 Tax=Cribrihabitans marinus TaxID=1227549 RepID=A0A1H7AG32_9RHOB|nr:F0F1 ATP synthase subunit epsilon [Cribrihabitans marinus]GGH31686.1 ATP synthase epsilon chain 1 [Cribrihabitans marinus]SEJ64549.1 ATP synthase F1 subcomplex epsilon subunit [Cribrihabitans marinus]
MADTMQFDLVSPERSLASFQVRAVQIPGADGDMTAMPDHAPTITTLRPGLVKAEGPDGTNEFVVTGGFAEVSSDAMSVLAEKAIPVTEMTRDHLDDMIAEARTVHEEAKEKDHPNLIDDAAKLLADMEALGTHMNL